MNATEDGDEPVGEAPELPRAQYDHEVAEYIAAWLCKWPEMPVAYTIAEPGHIENIPALGENERQAIAEIRQYATENASAKALREMCIGFHGKPISNFTVNGDDILAILDKWGV